MKIISHLVWDESEQRMVEIYGTEKYKFKTAAIWISPGYTYLTPGTYKSDGNGSVYKVEEKVKNSCACGGKFVGDCHSDWCDSLKPVEEDEDLPF